MRLDSKISSRRTLVAVCAVLFLTFLDTTIVSVALADVQSSLHAGVTQLQWIVNGYALPFASLMMIAGSLSDRFGRRRVMLLGLSVFGVGSVLAAVAPNPATLIAARVIMGIGAAASEPGTLSVIRHAFPDQQHRARALGAWAAVSGLALALGPVVGGALVGLWSWRAIFWFNVVATAIVLLAAATSVPESADPPQSRPDFLGFIIGAVSIAAITFAVILGETKGLLAPTVVALYAIGVLALGAFVVIERRSESPMLDLAYLRLPAFSGSLAVAFVLFFGIFSIFFFTALYLSSVTGYSPYRIAVEFLPMTVTMMGAAGFAGRRIARRGARVLMVGGSVIAGIGILTSEACLSQATPSLWLILTLALAGSGFGMGVVAVTSVSLETLPPSRSGMAASATNTSRELGAVFGVAVLGALVNAHLTNGLTTRLQALKIPANFISIVITAIETGKVPSGVVGSTGIEVQVIQAAYGAFRSGLELSLLASGIALVVVAFVAALTVREKDRPNSRGGIEG